ncbi:MAG: hypothetical protein JRE64_12465 [Deltaproteobacteria bacterium]|nr:hypothetical protein [Deltaproteobacteria bacterium]
MLERLFLNLIEKIVEVQHSHKVSSEEDPLLSRNWEFIFSDFDGWLVLYCSTRKLLGGYWLYPMLLPNDNVEDLKKRLPEFNIHQPSAAYGHVMSGEKHWLEPSWGNFEDFKRSEIPLFFYRQYYGRAKGKENYYEFNPIVTHPLDLHWSEKHNSYCRTDEQGDEIEIVKIINHNDVSLILVRRKVFEKLLYLGDWCLVRYFSFIRFNAESPSYDSFTREVYEPKEYEAKFKIIRCRDEYVEFRGAQIERARTPKAQLLSWRFSDNEEEIEKKYAEFIVHDWKNKKILKNYSIDPKNFANYFTKSDLPFETSPIFFKAEVLDKYKNNPDKYELQERTISCRGGWYLETYDINQYNQVHTYAVYLARLPYKEQLHWLQYNEAPKGDISKRAFQTDFEAKFPYENPLLQQLQESLETLRKTEVGDEKLFIWSPKGGSWETASKGLHYVNSENANQWHDFIIAIANATNEGFLKKPLSKIAASLGNEDNQLGTLGLLKFIIKESNNEDKIPLIHGVLNDLQIKRGKGKAHGTWDTPDSSLIDDATKRLQDVIQAIKQLKQIVESL